MRFGINPLRWQAQTPNTFVHSLSHVSRRPFVALYGSFTEQRVGVNSFSWHRILRAGRAFSLASRMTARRSARLSAAQAEASTISAPDAPTTKSRKRKASAVASSAQEQQPTTTKKKPSVPNGSSVAPPATPTPGPAGLMAAGTKAKRPRHSAVNRLADPKSTNAPLLSPETSRLVESKPVGSLSPSKVKSLKTTTANILEEACAHLIKVDPRMKPLVDKHYCRIFSPEGLAESIDPFESLASGIISQQVSGAAAKSIKTKFKALFCAPGADPATARFPHPSEVATCSIDKLRTAGLSQRKAEYIQGLAEKFSAGELTADMLASAPYEEVLEKLTAVRGLGRWSVEMFTCFALKRMDVFSLGDLGVQRGMAAFVGRDVAKLKSKGGKWKYMSEQDMKELSDRFAPYRSVFMWYMWRVEETDVSTLE